MDNHDHDLFDEAGYDRVRLAQWRTGAATEARFTQRDLGRLTTGLSLAAAAVAGR